MSRKHIPLCNTPKKPILCKQKEYSPKYCEKVDSNVVYSDTFPIDFFSGQNRRQKTSSIFQKSLNLEENDLTNAEEEDSSEDEIDILLLAASQALLELQNSKNISSTNENKRSTCVISNIDKKSFLKAQMPSGPSPCKVAGAYVSAPIYSRSPSTKNYRKKIKKSPLNHFDTESFLHPLPKRHVERAPSCPRYDYTKRNQRLEDEIKHIEDFLYELKKKKKKRQLEYRKSFTPRIEKIHREPLMHSSRGFKSAITLKNNIFAGEMEK